MVGTVIVSASVFVGLWEMVVVDLLPFDGLSDSARPPWDCIVVTLMAGILAAIGPTIMHMRTLKENRMLTGILPICSKCKKIRDGEGHWTDIEAYIRQRSRTEFSHSLCPECMKELYPDIR